MTTEYTFDEHGWHSGSTDSENPQRSTPVVPPPNQGDLHPNWAGESLGWLLLDYAAWQLAQAAVDSGQQSAKAQAVAQRGYDTAVAAGCPVVSSITPSISGTYAIGDADILKINAQQTSILTRGTFTNGLTTRGWLDTAGAVHVFPTTAAFTAFAEAVAQYDDALVMALAAAQAGAAWAPPATPVAVP